MTPPPEALYRSAATECSTVFLVPFPQPEKIKQPPPCATAKVPFPPFTFPQMPRALASPPRFPRFFFSLSVCRSESPKRFPAKSRDRCADCSFLFTSVKPPGRRYFDAFRIYVDVVAWGFDATDPLLSIDSESTQRYCKM